MTSVPGFIMGYMSKQAAPGTSHVTDLEAWISAVERLKKSTAWRLSGLAPSVGTFAGGVLGGHIGEWTAGRKQYKDRIRRALWGAVMGGVVGGVAGSITKEWIRGPLKNRIVSDILGGTEGS